MPGVNVSSVTIRTQIAALKRAAEQLSAARRSIMQQYQQVTSRWNDSKSRELGDIVNESSTALRNIEKVFLQGQKALLNLLTAVEEYERQNLYGAPGVSGEVSSAGGAGGGAQNANTFDNNYIANLAVANGLVGCADFGGLDTLTARDMYMSIAETKEQFPELDLRFVGSAQARNKHIADRLTNMYLDAYRAHYPDASDEDLMPLINQQVAEDMNGFEPGDGTIAQSLFISEPRNYGEEILSEFNGITINESYGGDYGHFSDVRRADVLARWKPEGCDTPRATVDHELGHQIARLTDAHNDLRIQELYADFMDLGVQGSSDALSGYSRESIHEFIAEAWSEYRNNPNCRPLAMEVAGRIIEIYESSPMRLVRTRRM